MVYGSEVVVVVAVVVGQAKTRPSSRQLSDSLVGPSQTSPTLFGIQPRDRIRSDFPQVAEQPDHSFHGIQADGQTAGTSVQFSDSVKSPSHGSLFSFRLQLRLRFRLDGPQDAEHSDHSLQSVSEEHVAGTPMQDSDSDKVSSQGSLLALKSQSLARLRLEGPQVAEQPDHSPHSVTFDGQCFSSVRKTSSGH